MVVNGNECANALYNTNRRELHVSTLMGFWCIMLNFPVSSEHHSRVNEEIMAPVTFKPCKVNNYIILLLSHCIQRNTSSHVK